MSVYARALLLLICQLALFVAIPARAAEKSALGKPCSGPTAQAALACMKTGCAGWSMDIAKQTTDGKKWHEVYYGLSSKAEALRAAGKACDRTGKPKLVGCNLERLYAPSGGEAQLDP